MSVIGKLEPTKTEFRWKIEKFREKMNSSVGTYFNSPNFVTSWTDLESTKWQLQIYPGGKKEKTKDHIGLFVFYYGATDTTAVWTLSVSNESSETEFKSRCTGACLFKNARSWGYDSFVEKESVMDRLADDTLTISCFISISKFSEDDDDNKASAFNYFEELLENKFNDVTFAFGRRKISLHKAILTSISPVFQAMFEHEMKEKIESVVKITDIKYDVALEMFRYIYCRRINNIDAIAEDLLVAADKYAIAGLKASCEKSISKSLNVENVLKRSRLMTTYETTSLKTKVIEFIVSHIKELIDMPEFKQLDGDCKDEIMKALANTINH